MQFTLNILDFYKNTVAEKKFNSLKEYHLIFISFVTYFLNLKIYLKILFKYFLKILDICNVKRFIRY
jgi:hypothetical protein